MSGGRGRGRGWNRNQEPWHQGQGANFQPYNGRQHYYDPRHNFRGGYGYSQPPPALAFNPLYPPPCPQNYYNHSRQDNGYNNGCRFQGNRRGGGYTDRNQRQQPRSRPSTPSLEKQRSSSSTPSEENQASITSNEQSSDSDINGLGLARISSTSQTADENVNGVSRSEPQDDKIERMEGTPLQLAIPQKEANVKDGNN